MILSMEDVIKINNKIATIKQSNSDEKIVLELLYELKIDLLKKISDKDMVCFESEHANKQLTVSEILEIEEILDLFVSDIKNSDLSPYERYIAVYSMVKSFKEYKYYKNSREEDIKYPDESRNIYFTLFNDYMVCVGYVFLLKKLLKKVGINSIEVSTTIGKSPKPNHAKCLVNIVDPKYNIDGYFMNDITNDNSISEKDFFRNCYIHSSIDYTTEINDDLNLQDFYEPSTNNLEKHLINNNLGYIYLKKLDPDYFHNIESEMVKKFIESKTQYYDKRKLKKINMNDSNLPNIIHETSTILSDKFIKYILNNYDDFFVRLQNHFIKKSKCLISPKKLYTATMNVKKFINKKPISIEDEKKISRTTMLEITNYRLLYINDIIKNLFNNIKKIIIDKDNSNEDKYDNKHSI